MCAGYKTSVRSPVSTIPILTSKLDSASYALGLQNNCFHGCLQTIQPVSWSFDTYHGTTNMCNIANYDVIAACG